MHWHLVDSTRTEPISMAHYMFGQPSAQRTRYICKCHSLTNVRKLELKAFVFLKIVLKLCRLATAKRNTFRGKVSRPLVKQWANDIKGPFDSFFWTGTFMSLALLNSRVDILSNTTLSVNLPLGDA